MDANPAQFEILITTTGDIHDATTQSTQLGEKKKIPTVSLPVTTFTLSPGWLARMAKKSLTTDDGQVRQFFRNKTAKALQFLEKIVKSG